MKKLLFLSIIFSNYLLINASSKDEQEIMLRQKISALDRAANVLKEAIDEIRITANTDVMKRVELMYLRDKLQAELNVIENKLKASNEELENLRQL